MLDTGTGGGGPAWTGLAVVLALLMVGSAATVGVAGAATSTTSANSSTTVAQENPIELAYVTTENSNHVVFLRADGTKVETNKSADVVGPIADLDGDGNLEATYVTSQGEIHAVDANNESQFLATSTGSSGTTIAVGDWTGDGNPEVVYANTSDNDYLYYVNTSGSPTQIASESAKAVFGVEDFDGDGATDVVYQGSSSGNLWYYNGSTAVNTQYGNFAADGTGGAPADFDRDGELRVPAIDGSGYPELVNATGDVAQLKQSNQDKTPVAAVDWAGDGRLEMVHLKSGNLAYTYLNGTTKTLYDASGNSISAEQGAGVAAVVGDTALSLSGFDATAAGDQNVTVTVTANKDLATLDVSLSGAESTTLTLADGDFTEASTDPYTYEATYDGSTDGDYTVALDLAESADGDTISNSRTDSVTVDDAVPTIGTVNLTDATNGDGLVTDGDDITVSAAVTGDVGTVEADLSAFDVGTVELTHANGDTYTATASVGSDAAQGDQQVSVTASDGQGNSDSANTGTLEVDTSPLTVDVGDSVTVEDDEQVALSVSDVSNASGDVTYEWSMGDGGTRTGEDIVYTYVTPGTYTATVEAVDDSGDTAKASMTVHVEDDSSSGDWTNEQTESTTTEQQTTANTKTTQTTVTTDDSDSTTANADTETNTDSNTATTTESANTPEGTATTATPNEQTPGEASGLGVAAAVVALAAAALLARRE